MAMVLTFAAVVGIAGHFKWLSDTNRWTGGRDIVTESRNRFAPLRKFLVETGAGSVGYVSRQTGDDASFFRAQAALAPVVVWRDARRPFVVGDAAPPAILSKFNLAVVRNFGNGLQLLRRQP